MPFDPDALYETAAVIEENVPSGAFDGVRATLDYLHHADRDINPDDLRTHAPCSLTRREAENIVYQLRAEGILSADDYDATALRLAFDAAAMLDTQEQPPENTVVATVPYEDPALEQTMFEPLLSHTIELIQSAEHNLALMSPFLSEEAYERLQPALHTAAGQGADITLITRYLTYGDKDYNREFAKRVLADEALAPVTTCYEYIDDESWITFHAKIVIADGEQAYLGTANLTHKGLGENLELGVVFRDATAGRFADLVDALQESAFLHEVVHDSVRFVRV